MSTMTSSLPSRPTNRDACYKWMTVLGVFFVFFPLGLGFFWGTLVVYTSSYIAVRLDTTSGVQAPWILNIRIVALSVSAVIAGRVKGIRVGKRLCIFTGIFLVCLSYFLGYFSIKHSNILFTTLFSICNGLGDGLTLIIIMDFVLEWADEKNSGLLISLARSGGYVGAIVANQIIMYYVNPANEKPDYQVGPSVYFSQEDILDRVPVLFVYLGSCYFVTQVVGFLMLRTKSSGSGSGKVDRRNNNENDNKNETTRINSSENNGQQVVRYVNENDNDNDNGNGVHKAYAKESQKRGHTHTMLILSSEETEGKEENKVEEKEEDGHESCSMTTREVMKTSQFYVMCFGFFLNYACSVNSFTFYKTYGQTIIHDDHFLTTVGLFVTVLPIFTGVLCGRLLDKYSVKTCLVYFNAMFSSTCVLFYLSPFVNRWVFAIATLVFTSMGTCTFTLYTIALVKLFGRTHQAFNVGVMSLASVGSLAVSPVIEIILVEFGWFYVFLATALLNVAVLICILIFLKPLPKKVSTLIVEN